MNATVQQGAIGVSVRVKNVGVNLDAAELVEQLSRYRKALPNLILTDYRNSVGMRLANFVCRAGWVVSIPQVVYDKTATDGSPDRLLENCLQC